MKRLLMLLIAFQAGVVVPPSAVADDEPQSRSSRAARVALAAAPNPFAGNYCGYLESWNSGSMSISDSGDVAGYFSFLIPNYSESYELSGRVTTGGVMRLKVVHTVTVNDRRRRTRTERYSVTVAVALDESGNLVAISDASFVLSRCP